MKLCLRYGRYTWYRVWGSLAIFPALPLDLTLSFDPTTFLTLNVLDRGREQQLDHHNRQKIHTKRMPETWRQQGPVGQAARTGKKKKGHHGNISIYIYILSSGFWRTELAIPAAFKWRCSVLVNIKDINEHRIKWHPRRKCQQSRSASRTQVSPVLYGRRTANVRMSLGHRRASMAVISYSPAPAISFKHPSSPQLFFWVGFFFFPSSSFLKFKLEQSSKLWVHTTFPAVGVPASTPQLILPALALQGVTSSSVCL